MNDEYNWSGNENDHQVEFRKPGTKMKFKYTELQFGRQMNYRRRDNSWIYGNKRGAYLEKREQRLILPSDLNLPLKPVCTAV